MTAHPLLLVGMSAREVAEAEAMRGLAAPYEADVAFLQLGDPSLHCALDGLCGRGSDRIVVVGVSLGSLGPGVSWLRRIAADWWRHTPGPVRLEIGDRLVRDADELTNILQREMRPITGTEPGLTSDAWERVPGHRHQVLVCRGPRCTARGADDVQVALGRELTDQGLGDDDVLTTVTGCQFPCNHAPVVSVQPDDAWYGRVDAQAAVAIVREHLIAGRPLARHLLARARRPD